MKSLIFLLQKYQFKITPERYIQLLSLIKMREVAFKSKPTRFENSGYISAAPIFLFLLFFA